MTTDQLSSLLTALADPTRRQALALLHDGREMCVCELMAVLGVSQSRMSRHMGALKAAGLVADRRDAQWVRYRRLRTRSAATRRVVDAVVAATTPPAAMAVPRVGKNDREGLSQ